MTSPTVIGCPASSLAITRRSMRMLLVDIAPVSQSSSFSIDIAVVLLLPSPVCSSLQLSSQNSYHQ